MNKIPSTAVRIYHGAYAVSARGNIYRMLPGNGTYVGRILSPYQTPTSPIKYVKLSYQGVATQFAVDTLIDIRKRRVNGKRKKT